MRRPPFRGRGREEAAAGRDFGPGQRSDDAALSELVSPEDEVVAGRRPVEEAFAARRDARRLLVVPQRRDALERLVLHATTLRIPVVEVEGGTLTSIAGFDGHQGVAVVVAPRRFASLDEILARAVERGEPPFILALDSLEDPQNLGTLLRSAEAAGVHGVVFPTRRQAPLSPAAVKASAGAVEHLLLCPVDDLPTALTDLHARGLRVAGAEADAPLTARESDLRGPLVIVVGSEGQGLGPAVRRRCDVLMRIPMRGRVDSLNAAVAGSILLFEALAQRGDAPPPRTRTQLPAESPTEAPTESPADEPPKPTRKRATKPAKAAETFADNAEAPDETAPKPRRRRANPVVAATAEPSLPEPAAEERRAEHEDLLPGGPPATAAEPDASAPESDASGPEEA